MGDAMKESTRTLGAWEADCLVCIVGYGMRGPSAGILGYVDVLDES